MADSVAPNALAGARLQALRRTTLLDSPVDEAFDRLARLATAALGVPIAAISLVDDQADHLIGRHGLAEPWLSRRRLPLSHSMARHVIARGRLLAVDDARSDGRLAGTPVVSKLGFIACAAAPLITPDGYVLGALCVAHTQPRPWTEGHKAVLRDLAASVMTEVALRQSLSALGMVQKQLTDSEARLNTLSEATRDTIFEYDLINRDIWWSQNFGWLYGYRGDDLGDTVDWWENLIHPDDYERVLASFNRAAQDGADFWSKEYRLRRADGTYAEIFARGSILRNESGQAERFVGALTDITARREIEAALRQSEERYRQLVENAQEGIWVMDPQGKTTFVNRRMSEMLGLSEREMLGRSFYEFMDDEGRAAAAAFIEQRRHGADTQRDLRFKRRDGTDLWAILSSEPVYADGRYVGAFAMVADITARKYAEEALAQERDLLQALMDNIPDTIYFKDTQSRFTRINNAQARVLGVDRPEDAVGKTDFDFFPKELAQAAYDEEQKAFRTGQPIVNRVEYNPTRDGRPRWFSATKVPLLGKAGQVVGLAGISRNITDSKEAEASLQAQKELFQNLVGVARAAAEKPTLQDTLRNVLAVSVRITHASQGTLLLVNAAGEVTNTMTIGGDNELLVARHAAEFVEKGLSGWVMRNRQTAWIHDTRADPRWVVIADEQFSGRSALSVPIASGADVLGVLTLVHPERRHFTAADVSLMESAVDQMALALRNAIMFEQARQLAEEMYALNQITRAALGAETLDDLYQTLANRMGAVLGADACYITAWDDVNQRAVAKATSQPDWKERYRDVEVLPGEKTLSQSALDTGRPIAVDDTSDSSKMSPRLANMFPAKSSLALPLIARNRKLGAVILSFDKYHHFTNDEIAVGERAARQVALALSNALLYQEMAEQHSRLEALIDSSRDGIVLVGSETNILVCNPIALNLLGLPGQSEDWIGQPLRAAMLSLAQHAPGMAKVILGETRRVAAGHGESNSGENMVGQRTLRWLHLPVLAQNANLGRLIVLRDVSEERALEQLREDLTQMMVHDLRSPLTVMLGATEALADKSPDRVAVFEALIAAVQGTAGEAGEALIDSARERVSLFDDLVRMIHDASVRMLGLVDAILDTNQLESNRMPIERVSLSIRALANEVLQLQAGVIQKRAITVENTIPQSFPYLHADMRLIDRVLQNLISNALKFTPEGGVIRLAARRTAQRAGTARSATISIYNSGPGIPLELKSRLFQKFVRGRQRGYGNGLGLAFCRLAVEAHEGRIWAESEPDQGATFYFTLPFYEAMS